jgi:hypothetical protein
MQREGAESGHGDWHCGGVEEAVVAIIAHGASQ